MRDFKPSKEFQNNCVLPPNNPSIKLLQSNKREKIDDNIDLKAGQTVPILCHSKTHAKSAHLVPLETKMNSEYSFKLQISNKLSLLNNLIFWFK